MLWIRWIAVGAVTLVILVLAAGQLGLLRGRASDNLGLRDGRLKRPSMTPNSVSSQADLHADHAMRAYARIEPLPASGDAQTSIARLRQVIEAMAGAKVIDQQADYLRVEFESRWMRFVDDAEFWFDPVAKVVQVRSASRVGRKDYGVNRVRIESIRRRLAREQALPAAN